MCIRDRLHSGRDPASEWGLANWLESIFLDVVTLSFCDGMLPEEFLLDRVPVMPEGFFDLERARASLPSRLDRVLSLIHISAPTRPH